MTTQNLSNLLLVATLKIGSISKSCEDERLSENLEKFTGAKKHKVKATKSLFKEALAPITAVEGKARRIHARMTFQGIGDDRLLAPKERVNHQTAMQTVKAEWQKAVLKFLANYDTHLAKEKADLKTAFVLEDYPTRQSAEDSFRFETGYLPMGSPHSFIQMFTTEAQRAEAEQLKAQYEGQLRNAVSNVTRTQFTEVLNLVRRVAEVLADPDKQLIDSPTRKGPLTYLREYVERLPMTNITNDPTVEALRQQVLSAIDVNTDILRDSELMRKAVAARAATIVQSFTTLGQRKFAA